jgi:small subunit ribosomal protein S5
MPPRALIRPENIFHNRICISVGKVYLCAPFSKNVKSIIAIKARFMAQLNIQKVKASELELKEKVVNIRRVAKVTKGGRTFSFSATVVVGNGNGIVGEGLGKAREVQEAIQKAIDDAKKNLISVPVHKGTIPHVQHGKFGAAKVMIQPASNGTGVIAGGSMRAVLESAGVKDVLAKSQGSSNPANVIKATIDALTKLRDPFTVSRNRSVSMDKVFKG